MSSRYGDRKLMALKRKADGLRDEFAGWRALSRKEKPFEKQFTQVRRIQTTLRPLRDEIRKALNDATPESALTQGWTIERKILAVYRIWEFFRSRWSQRQGRLKCVLSAADEFAWACYAPALKSAVGGPTRVPAKEPPLVYFNGSLSPFAVPRDFSFRGEDVPNEPLTGPLLQEILKKLPIPVVGIPWSQGGYIADALVIGHEVGHLVAYDFDLKQDLADALQRASLKTEHQPAWSAWMDEVFADIHGTLAAGPAFAETLIEFLSRDEKTITNQVRDETSWGRYPTDTLRVLLTLQVLHALGFKTQAEALKSDWLATYSTHRMQAFENDIEPLVSAILAGPYRSLGGKALTDVLTFTSEQQENARLAAERAAKQEDVAIDDPRALLAAFRVLWKTEAANRKKAETRLINTIIDSTPRGLRGPGADTPHDMQAIDRALGESLVQQLEEVFASD